MLQCELCFLMTTFKEGQCVQTLSVRRSHLPENEGCYVSGLPVGGVKKVRQSHRREGGQHVGTVQGVI
ncbi:hypothetical protein EYF80_023702 [Liparis tanakae]|uniref:Uncharacterized protein n=1 Tax=Liparis tanakae TaxID=230148 RepID=A0A4Z2HM99_9TELE|nr:hypothetical protein EYF80_023702 [Liparis tanakae]